VWSTRATSKRGRRLALAVASGWLLTATLAAPALAKGPSAGTLAAYVQEDKALAYEFAGIEGAKLGVELPGGPEGFLDVKQSSASRVVAGTALAVTNCYAADDDIVGCEINVGTAPHTQHELLAATIAHEVFHAYEVVMCGKVSTCKAMSFKWLVEGGAEWAGVQVAGKDSTSRRVVGKYFSTPSLPLFSREYTAIGFFDHLQSVGISPWSRFSVMFETTSNVSAYLNAVGGNSEFPETEASVFFREPSGWPWAERPESEPAPANVHFTPSTVAVGASGHAPLKVAEFADGVYHLNLTHMSAGKPILELVVKKGYARIRSLEGADVDQIVKGDVKLCSATGGCNCPGQPPEDYPLFKEGDLAITGGVPGGLVELVARKRCEPLLPARSCEGALPGYSSTVADVTEERLHNFAPGKFSKSEASQPAIGYYSSTCTFLFKDSSSIIMRPIPLEQESGPEHGVEPLHLRPGEAPPEEEVFHGVIASGFSISRYGTTKAATEGLRLQARLAASSTPVHGIGEEAFLSTRVTNNPKGGLEYSADGFVRVRNLTAYFLIAGDEEADPTAARGLLVAVAREL
jgi:hypothetical protein